MIERHLAFRPDLDPIFFKIRIQNTRIRNPGITEMINIQGRHDKSVQKEFLSHTIKIKLSA